MSWKVVADSVLLGDVAHRPVGAPAVHRPADAGVAGPLRNRTVGHFHAGLLRLLLPGRTGGLVTADEGVLPGQLELADGGLRQRPEQVHVPAIGLDRTQVGQAVVEAADRTGAGTGDAIAVDRVQRIHAQVQLGLRIDRLDRAVDGMAVEGHLHIEALRPRRVVAEPRAPHEAGAEAARAFRIQLTIAAGGHRDLRVGLLEARRYAQRGTVGRTATRRRATQAYRAGIEQLQVGTRRRAVQFADRRCAEALGIGRAQHEVVGHLPAQAVLGRELATEGGVIRVAPGQAQVQLLAERRVGEDRHAQLQVGLVDVIGAGGRLRRYAVVVADHRQRIRLVGTLVPAMLDAGGEGHRAGRQREQLAGQVGGEQAQFVLAAVAHHRLDPLQHVRGDRADATEDVQRHAARGGRTHRRIAQRHVHLVDVIAAVVGLFGLVLAVHAVDVPVPAAVGGMEVADQAGGEIGGVHLLLEHARTAFHRAAADQAHVVAGHQVEAERVVRVQARDHDVVGQRIAGGTVGSEEQRLRAGLVGRLAAVAQCLDVPLHGVGDVEAELAEQAFALRRRQHHVVFGEVEAVGAGEAMVVIGAVAAGAAVVTRIAHTGIGHDVLRGAGRCPESGSATARDPWRTPGPAWSSWRPGTG
ncbi:hypothetical protein G6F57_013621 [Rhizopus arrhizus]|nr:hypothetical protein G6F57_013621 [Rhizopus arrhizus]